MIISLVLDYQSKFDSTLPGIRNKLSDLKKDFEELRSDLSITKLVNTKLKEKLVILINNDKKMRIKITLTN